MSYIAVLPVHSSVDYESLSTWTIWDLFIKAFVRSTTKAFLVSIWKVMAKSYLQIQFEIRWLQASSAYAVWRGIASVNFSKWFMSTRIWMYPVSDTQLFWWSICTTSLNSELSSDFTGNFIFLGSFTCRHDRHALIPLSQAFIMPGQSNRRSFQCWTLPFPWCPIWSSDLSNTSVYCCNYSMMRLYLCIIFSSSNLLQATTSSAVW